MRLVVLVVFVVLTATSNPGANASTSAEITEQLLGWSEDGQTWAVLSSADGEETIDVRTGGKLVMQVCNQANLDVTCEAGAKMAVVNLEERKGRPGILRVNVETHKALARFKLKRIGKAWRKAFDDKYSLERGPYGDSFTEGRCAKGWTLRTRSNKKVARKVKAKTGCLTSHGGYLHDSGKYALIKATAFYLDNPDERSDTKETGFTFVDLSKPSQPR